MAKRKTAVDVATVEAPTAAAEPPMAEQRREAAVARLRRQVDEAKATIKRFDAEIKAVGPMMAMEWHGEDAMTADAFARVAGPVAEVCEQQPARFDVAVTHVRRRVEEYTESLLEQNEFRHNSTGAIHNIANLSRVAAKQWALREFKTFLATLEGE